MAFIKAGLVCLSSESVESTALPLECVDDIHGGDSLPLGMFSIGNGVTDDVFKEHLQNSTSFFVNESRDTFHTSTTGQATDGWLGDA